MTFLTEADIERRTARRTAGMSPIGPMLGAVGLRGAGRNLEAGL
jgi:hypothetical protein